MNAMQENESRVVLAAYGDSLVAGWGLAQRDGLVPRLEAELAASGPCHVPGVRVLDFGVSGDTSLDGLERLDAVLAARPRAVLLEFGANDCYQGIPVKETRAALERMIAALLGAGAGIFLAGWRTRADMFSPCSDDPDLAGLTPIAPPEFNNGYVKRSNALHGELAAKFGLPFMPHILDPLDGQPGCFQADGVHPSAKGAAVLAGFLAPLLAPLLLSPSSK
ncbi:acyl-CoA thioesterase-1 [Humidesulfovibrio mexicanus]|uniref:Acyl-CoA thioesterase-1 n=1 Tax=Humidesulfovibrio mexicanus TaxID=147047 RepID=A0A238Y6I7_9BACT|nr:GDSL-type esterase/lipase family protein [Humidesulfovibrio mexicanus]SNR66184.1 acyl-CoA thioesterase-1 [Humidesulfovibrio mexicanus]